MALTEIALKIRRGKARPLRNPDIARVFMRRRPRCHVRRTRARNGGLRDCSAGYVAQETKAHDPSLEHWLELWDVPEAPRSWR